MNIRRPIPSAALAGAVALGVLTLSACAGTSDAADKGGGGKLEVVASFYPLQYLAEEIGGDHITVDTLTKPGVEPHDLELKPRQIGALGKADVLLYLKGIQPAVDEAIALAEVKNTVDAATLTTLERHGTGAGHDHGHADEEAGHDHGSEAGSDPHVWLDPVKYAEIARGVGAVLEKADPGHAADYAKNTTALVAKLDALDADFAKGLENTATRTFVTTHSAFGYLAERYGLDQEGISGVDPESEPSPARIKEIQDIAARDKVTTVFFETLASDKTARTLAGDTGLRTDVLDPLEGITDRSKGADYLQVMRSNLAALQKALGAK
ncbi:MULTISPECIES: metal ABC transporter substrate-binding protein [unclassified Streptomyces]|uniref:metal ABC transporter substrate-binding protein n=1 Tax=unclassified Streptomyces TaxID=2593676 RepID=UPI001660517C|nr:MULTISPECIES: metal ABC transporter substrate-binding protein [unclassified Streptomyces]MBD0708079.1 zinc ABC transporter substrate-binding protein [Streptomyces sp. CBMA291]MBD0715827.1 zinc ABC transporter substrate-binding protein [Streptomyces sp. CBMA370]